MNLVYLILHHFQILRHHLLRHHNLLNIVHRQLIRSCFLLHRVKFEGDPGWLHLSFKIPIVDSNRRLHLRIIQNGFGNEIATMHLVLLTLIGNRGSFLLLRWKVVLHVVVVVLEVLLVVLER